jgi:hypothetical protein
VATTISANEFRKENQQTLSVKITTREPDQNSARTNRTESNGQDETRTEMASSFLLCCVLAATVAIASGGEVPLAVYEINGKPVRGMDLLTETHGRKLADEWADLRGGQEPDTLEPEDFLDWLEKMQGIVSWNWRGYERRNKAFALLRDTIEVANADGYCSSSHMGAFLLANKEPSTFKALTNYLNYYMPQKLANCAKRTRGTLPAKRDLPFELELDAFYGRILGVPKKAIQLANGLRQTNLLKDDVNFAKGLKIVERNDFCDDEDSVEKKINEFLFRECEGMRYDIGEQLSALILSNVIEGRVERDPRLLKLIEYDHACYYVTMNEREFMENVKRNSGQQISPHGRSRVKKNQ